MIDIFQKSKKSMDKLKQLKYTNINMNTQIYNFRQTNKRNLFICYLYRLQPQLQLLIDLEYSNLESRLSSTYQLKQESNNNNNNVISIDLVSVDNSENFLSNT